MSGEHKGQDGAAGPARPRTRRGRGEEECDKVARLSARLPRNLQEKNGKKYKASKRDTESDEEEETGGVIKADHDRSVALKHTAARLHARCA